MKEKKPFYKNGLIVGLLLIVISLPIAGTAGSLGAVVFLVGVVTTVVSLFRRIFKKREKPQARPKEGDATPVQPIPAQNPIQEAKPVVAVTKATTITETHRIAGTSYHHDEIEGLGVPNDDYDLTAAEAAETYDFGDRIYEYVFFSKPALVPEPENPNDPKAIRVEADGVHIGYIKAGSCSHVRKLMDAGRIASMDLEIYGGRYKELEETESGRPKLSKDSSEYGAKLTLYVKKDE